jgi:predicted dinucleotide-binding enzyme
MKIAILGSGSVGSALGKKWAKAGHAVTFGARDVDDFTAARPGRPKKRWKD